jgi:hypothetical protein
MPPRPKLPAAAKEAFAVSPVVGVLQRLQWAVDPPYLRGLRGDALRDVGRLHAQYLAEEARLEAQRQTLFAETMQKVSQRL